MNINNNFNHAFCPICFSRKIQHVGSIECVSPVTFSTQQIVLENKPELWVCKRCRSYFAQNVIPENIAYDLYAKGTGGERWPTGSVRESKGKEIIRVLESIFQKGKRVLDIGCNTGELLDFAKAQGCYTFGVELSETSREVLIKKGHTSFSSLNKVSGSYDVITAFDLVEHLYNVPMFFDVCRDKLAANGVLVILTGNISSISARIAGRKWWYLKYPEHISFISKYYLKSLSGLHLDRLIPTYASVGYRQSFTSICKGFVMGLLSGTYQGLPSLGPDHMLVVLRK